MKVFVLMSHYGDKLELTKQCVESLIKYDKNIEGIIIANNNKSNLDPRSISLSKKVFVKNNGKNLGYGGGINSIIPLALSKGATHLFFINNDCTIDQPFLSDLISFSKVKEDAGIIGISLKYRKENKWVFDIGGRISPSGKPYHEEVSSLSELKPIKSEFAGCVLVKKEVVGKIKGFDENFFLYFEDVDFSLRAKREGFKTYVVPKAYIYHGLSKTVGLDSEWAIYHQCRSGIIYSKKYKKIVFLFEYLVIIFKRLVKNPRNAKAGLLGVLDGFTNKLASNMVS